MLTNLYKSRRNSVCGSVKANNNNNDNQHKINHLRKHYTIFSISVDYQSSHKILAKTNTCRLCNMKAYLAP